MSASGWVWCCEDLQEQAETFCAVHGDDCPDVLIVRRANGEFGLPIRDGGSSTMFIGYCPWCGSPLPVVEDPDDTADEVA